MNDRGEADQDERLLFSVEKYGDHCQTEKKPAEQGDVFDEDPDSFEDLL